MNILPPIGKACHRVNVPSALYVYDVVTAPAASVNVTVPAASFHTNVDTFANASCC